jgi:hypothetical protein
MVLDVDKYIKKMAAKSNQDLFESLIFHALLNGPKNDNYRAALAEMKTRLADWLAEPLPPVVNKVWTQEELTAISTNVQMLPGNTLRLREDIVALVEDVWRLQEENKVLNEESVIHSWEMNPERMGR